MKLKKIMPLFAIALGVVLAVAASGFKEGISRNGNDTFYYFQYDPGKGPESSPASWVYTTDESLCGGEDASCKIVLDQTKVNTTVNPFTINASSVGGTLPVVAGGIGHQVPDPNSSFYTVISNQDTD